MVPLKGQRTIRASTVCDSHQSARGELMINGSEYSMPKRKLQKINCGTVKSYTTKEEENKIFPASDTNQYNFECIYYNLMDEEDLSICIWENNDE